MTARPTNDAGLVTPATWRELLHDPRSPLPLRTRVLLGSAITAVLALACGLLFAVLDPDVNSAAILTPRGALRVLVVAAGVGALMQVGAVVGLRLRPGAVRWCWMAVVRGGVPFVLLLRAGDIAHANPTSRSLGLFVVAVVFSGFFFALFQGSQEVQLLGDWPRSAGNGTRTRH